MNNQKPKNSILKDVLQFVVSLFEYFIMRARQVVLYGWALILWFRGFAADLKSGTVRRMFWGRSSFYRSAFQFSVGILTIVIGVGGLAGRLNLFSSGASEVLAYPTEQVGDADFLDENSSMQAIVASSAQTRAYEVQKYIVQRGDTVSSIAEEFGISEDTLRWANGITGDYLKIGQELEILPINGIRYTVKSGDTLASIAQKYQAAEQDIFDINWLESRELSVGQELLVPNGLMPQPKPVVKPVVATTSTYTAPPVYYGGSGGSGSFVRPCACGGITNWFSAWHGGVDIAQAGGCNIVAADSGTVTMARWYGAGGLQIMIDHGNGFVTLYAHHSAIYVKEGQQVTKGQPIGYMGCTGRCTGTHLHFGVQKNGVWVNPLSYVPI